LWRNEALQRKSGRKRCGCRARRVNMATGRDTLIHMRGNDDFEGSATLGPDGVYYAERVRRRGRLQLVRYAQLANP